MRRYSAKLREAGNLPVEARVGVNTGEVVVRSIATGEGHAEYTPVGHSTGLAARMQALAPTGSVAATEQAHPVAPERRRDGTPSGCACAAANAQAAGTPSPGGGWAGRAVAPDSGSASRAE